MRNIKWGSTKFSLPSRISTRNSVRARSRVACGAVADETQSTDADALAGGASTAAENGAGGAASGEPSRADGGPRGFDGVTKFIGMRWRDAETVTLEIRPELMNRGGLLSGVVTYALVDYCMGSALWVQTSKEEHIATMNISINYIQTATAGEIVCRSTVDRRNRSSAMLRSEIRHEDGRLLVTAVGSYAIFPARKRLTAGAEH
jgi:uncharacterized protein (TIGR00369 family)